VAIIGGHTLDDPEPKYGLAVTGVVHPDKIVTNAGAQVGDNLILTKPLGMGIMTTALKRGLLSEENTREIMQIMATLNKAAAEVMMEVGVNACTDITGFGLLGHLHEMALASRVEAKVYLDRVPVVPETWKLVRKDIVPGGTKRNLNWLSHAVHWDPHISPEAQLVLCDAQTSGGLLMAVSRDRTERMIEALTSAGVTCAIKIGEIVKGPAGQIQVLPSE
jgi:selenide,water dikinase